MGYAKRGDFAKVVGGSNLIFYNIHRFGQFLFGSKYEFQYIFVFSEKLIFFRV